MQNVLLWIGVMHKGLPQICVLFTSVLKTGVFSQNVSAVDMFDMYKCLLWIDVSAMD